MSFNGIILNFNSKKNVFIQLGKNNRRYISIIFTNVFINLWLDTNLKNSWEFSIVISLLHWWLLLQSALFLPQALAEMISDLELTKDTPNLFIRAMGLSWQHHQMETCSVLLAPYERNPLVAEELPLQRLVMWSFGVFFDLCLNKWLSNQPRYRWFEMPLHSSWHHCNGNIFCEYIPGSLPCFNSFAPGRFQFNFRWVIFKLTLVNGGWGISNEIALRWMPLDLTDDKSTLVQVIAWCHQVSSHYLSQCWSRSMSPNGVTRPQIFNCT